MLHSLCKRDIYLAIATHACNGVVSPASGRGLARETNNEAVSLCTLCLSQSVAPIDAKELKHIGEVNPAVLEFRMQRCSQAANSPSGGPSALLQAIALADGGQSPSPVTPNLNLRTESRTRAQSSSNDTASKNVNPKCDRPMHTPAHAQITMATPHLRGGQSAPAKLHSHPQNTGTPQTDSSSPVSTTSTGNCANKNNYPGQSHPLTIIASSTSSKCCVQSQSGHPRKPANPEVGGRDSTGQKSVKSSHQDQKQSEVAGSFGSTSDETSSGAAAQLSSEEARKLRQTQQRLQKEEWQRKYGLGTKRHSEGSVPVPEHSEAARNPVAKEACKSDDGFQVDELITDGMFSFLHSATMLLLPYRELCSYTIQVLIFSLFAVVCMYACMMVATFKYCYQTLDFLTGLGTRD